MGAVAKNHWKRRLVVASSCLAVVGLYLPATMRRQLTGDEPHHLVMAASLAWDRDLDLKNNYADKTGLPFDPRDPRWVPDHHVIEDTGGRWRPKHEPGFPLLLAPWLRLAGLGGVLGFLALIYAGLGVLLHEVGVALGLQPRALSTLALLFLSVAPIPYYSLQLFPETTAALVVTTFALGVVKGPLSSRTAFFLGCIVGFLPWLRLRFVPIVLAAVIAAAIFWPRKSFVAFFAPAVLSALTEGGYFFYFFHRFLPPPSTHQGFGPLFEAVKGMLGLFLDAQVGLLILSPVFLLSFVFFKDAFPSRSVLGVFSFLSVGGTVVLCGSYRDFPAGWCPQPARYLTALLPLLLVPVAVGLCRLKGPRRTMARVLWGGSAVLPVAYVVAPGATYTGLAYHWLEQKTGVQVTRFLPSLVRKELFFGTFPERLAPLLYVVPLVLAGIVLFAWKPSSETPSHKVG